MSKKGNPIIAVKIDPDTLQRVNEIAKKERQFEGNRSLFIRKAVYDLVARFEKPEATEETAA